MRIGLMIGPETGPLPREGRAARRRRRGGRAGRLHLDLGARRSPTTSTRSPRSRSWVARPTRIELGTAVAADPDPPSGRHGAAGAVDPGGVRRSLHARARARRTTGSSRTCSAFRTSARAPRAELPRGVERGVRRPGPGRRRERRVPRAQPARRHRHPPTPILLAALAPVMLRVAGEQASGTILWMADERAIAEHIVPRITKAAAEGRDDRRRGSSPASPSRCAPKDEVDARARVGEPGARARRVLAELPATARARRRHRRRRHPRGGRRVGHRRAAAQLPRRRGHRPVGPHPPARARPRRAHRVAAPDRGVPRSLCPEL